MEGISNICYDLFIINELLIIHCHLLWYQNEMFKVNKFIVKRNFVPSFHSKKKLNVTTVKKFQKKISMFFDFFLSPTFNLKKKCTFLIVWYFSLLEKGPKMSFWTDLLCPFSLIYLSSSRGRATPKKIKFDEIGINGPN